MAPLDLYIKNSKTLGI